jgi:hypothetical protein
MEDFKKNLYLSAVDTYIDGQDKVDLSSACERVLKDAKIAPKYLLPENQAVFEESRNRLNTEPGLIIANHPGFYDNFLILNAVKRPDIKIVASDSAYEDFYSKIGEDFLIRATHDPKEIHAFMKKIKEHIDSGGVVLIYPTAGVDRVDKDNSFEFKGGLSLILKRCMKPSDMVYSFYVDPNDIRTIVDEKVSRLPGVASAVIFDRAINSNSLKEEVEVKVGERYSTADEWLGEIADSGKDEKSSALAEHFLAQFKQS